MIDKAPILAIPPKAFGDKHFATEFNKIRMFLLSLADESNIRTLGYKGYLKITDTKPTEAGLYRLIEIGSYANLTPAVDSSGNPTTITSTQGKLNEVYYDGSKFVKSQVDLPGTTVTPTFEPNNAINAQGGKQIYDASKSIVNKGFESTEVVSEVIGWDLNGASVTNIPSNQVYIYANNLFATKPGIIPKINVNVDAGGSVTAVLFSLVNNQVSIASQIPITLTSGQNTVNVNIPIQTGQALGWLKTTSLKLRFTDGTSGRTYLTNGVNPPTTNFYTGYLAYNYAIDHEYLDTSYNVDSIKDKLTKSFKKRSFTHELDFRGDFYQRYTKLFNNVKLKSGANPIFGKMNYLHLTGGDLSFDTNFVLQSGSASYIPTKYNVITTWVELDMIRYFIENFDLKPLNFDTQTKSYYDFTNKVANTEMTAITADYGNAFLGKTSYFKINSVGTMLNTKTAAADLATDSIYVSKGGLTDYKVTMFMGFGAQFIFSPNDATGGTYSDYIRITKGSPNSTIRHTNASGSTDSTTTLIPSTATSGYLWEIEVRGSDIKVYINSGLAYQGVTTQTGGYFAMAFTGVGDFINSFLLEEL